MAYVLSVFIVKAFDSQNDTKRSTRNYSSSGDEAINTISSAKDNRNSYSDAIVYACRLVLFIPCVL
jgi:hypothetical protein